MKETWDKAMPERTDVCPRAEDLVAYLYGEASEAEARDFKRHAEQCAACHTELAAFGGVREAIGAWREQALGSITSLAFESNNVAEFASAGETHRRKRSALAAIREFFTLSPLWMRAATAAVVLIFCVLAFIAIAHFREQPKVEVANGPSNNTPVQEINKPTVAEKDQQQTGPAIKDQIVTPQKEVVARNDKPQTARQNKNGSIGSQQLTKNRRPVLRRNLNESDELAENDYLPFTAPSREERLPSLADLAEEPNH